MYLWVPCRIQGRRRALPGRGARRWVESQHPSKVLAAWPTSVPPPGEQWDFLTALSLSFLLCQVGVLLVFPLELG